MKIFRKKLKQNLALLLAALMVLTCVPVDGYVVQAAEAGEVLEEPGDLSEDPADSAEPQEESEVQPEDSEEEPENPEEQPEEAEEPEDPEGQPEEAENPEGQPEESEEPEDSEEQPAEPEENNSSDNPEGTGNEPVETEEPIEIIEGSTATVTDNAAEGDEGEATTATVTFDLTNVTLADDTKLVTLSERVENDNGTFEIKALESNSIVTSGDSIKIVVEAEENYVVDEDSLSVVSDDDNSQVAYTKATGSDAAYYTITLNKTEDNSKIADTTVSVEVKAKVTFNFDEATKDGTPLVALKDAAGTTAIELSSEKTAAVALGDFSFTLPIEEDKKYSVGRVMLIDTDGADSELTPSDGVYTVEAGKVAGSAIKVTTTPQVKFEAKDVFENSVKLDGAIQIVTSGDVVIEPDTEGYVDSYLDEMDSPRYAFGLKAGDDYVIQKVEYKIGNSGTAKTLSEDDDDHYTLSDESFTSTSDAAVITVAVAPKLYFALAEGVEVQDSDGNKATLGADNSVTITENLTEGYTFKLKGDGNYVVTITQKGETDAKVISATEGVYTIETNDITAGATVAVTVKEEVKVTFQIPEDPVDPGKPLAEVWEMIQGDDEQYTEGSESITEISTSGDAVRVSVKATDPYKLTEDCVTASSDVSDAAAPEVKVISDANVEGKTVYEITLAKKGGVPVATNVAINVKANVTFDLTDTAQEEGQSVVIVKDTNNEELTLDNNVATVTPGDFEFKLSVKEGSKNSVSQVTVTSGDAGRTLKPDEAGVYTVTAEEVAEGATIAVSTAPWITFAVEDMFGNGRLSPGDAYSVIADGETLTLGADDHVEANMVNGKLQYSFKLESTKNYEVKDVTYKIGESEDTKDLKPGTGDIYTFTDESFSSTSGNAVITVSVGTKLFFDLTEAEGVTATTLTPGDAIKDYIVLTDPSEKVGFKLTNYGKAVVSLKDADGTLSGPIEGTEGVYEIESKQIKPGSTVTVATRKPVNVNFKITKNTQGKDLATIKQLDEGVTVPVDNYVITTDGDAVQIVVETEKDHELYGDDCVEVSTTTAGADSKGTVTREDSSDGEVFTVKLATKNGVPVETNVTINVRATVAFNLEDVAIAEDHRVVIPSDAAGKAFELRPKVRTAGDALVNMAVTPGDLALKLPVEKGATYSIGQVQYSKGVRTSGDATRIEAENDIYTVPAEDLAGSVITVKTTPWVQFAVEDTVDGELEFNDALQVLTDGDAGKTIVTLGENNEAHSYIRDTGESMYSFRLRVNNNYEVKEVSYKIGTNTAKELTPVDGCYTILDSGFNPTSEAAEVTVITAPKLNFDLTEAREAGKDIFKVQDVAGDALLNLTDGNGSLAITGGDADKVTDDFTFKLAKQETQKNYGGIQVTLTIPGEDAKTLEPDENGLYTIGKEEIVAGSTIKVTVVEEYKVNIITSGDASTSDASTLADLPFNVQIRRTRNGETDEDWEYVGEDTTFLKGDSLEFALEMKEGQTDKGIEKVTIKSGETELASGTAHTYSLLAEKCTGDIGIIVGVGTAKGTVYVQKNAHVTDVKLYLVTDDKLGDAIASGTDLTHVVEVGKSYVLEIVPATGYNVTDVKIGNTALSEATVKPENVAATSKYVTFDATSSDQMVEITTAIDSAARRTISFNGSDYKAYINQEEVSGTYETAEGSVDVKLVADDGYEITDVKIGTESATGTNGVYTVNIPDDTKAQTVTVTTKQKKTVTITQAKKDVTYSIENAVLRETTEDGDKVYDVDIKAENVKITVTVPNDKTTPEVSLENRVLTKDEGEGYVYTIKETDLYAENNITVNGTYTMYTVQANFDTATVKQIRASFTTYGDDVIGTKNWTSENPATWQVPYGETMNISIEANENCGLVSPGDGGRASLSIPVNDSSVNTIDGKTILINIESQGYDSLMAPQYEGSGLTADVNGVYTVDAGRIYTLRAGNGASYSDVALAGQIDISAVDEKGKTADAVTQKPAVTDGATSVNLEIATSGDAGKTLSVTIYKKAATADAAPTAIGTYKMYVRPSLTDNIAISGVKLKNGEGTIQQTVDTSVSYAVTMKDARANASMLRVETVDASGKAFEAGKELIKAEMSTDGKLVVQTLPPTTGDGANDNAGQVRLIDTTTGTVLAALNVKVKAPAFSGKKPTVKLKSANSTSLTLTLGTPVKSIETPVKGGLYYKVAVTPAAGAPEGSITKETIYFVEKTAATSQDAVIKVNSKDPEKEAGKGGIGSYTVKVSMVQVRDRSLLKNDDALDAKIVTAGAEEANILLSVDAAKEGVFETKRASYATSLKFKKVASTIYTGQDYVVAADLVFDKNASYEAEVDTVNGISSKYFTNFNASIVNGQLVLENIGDYVAGTYNIQVKTVVPDEYEDAAITATYKLTIVQGICYINLLQNGLELYKPEGKAASLKITPEYNGGTKSYAPKAKKLTWEIGKEEGYHNFVPLQPDDYLYGMVQVDKNGKVTVNKNYRVSEEVSENQFVVRAAAADYAGNEEAGYAKLTITSEPMEIGDINVYKRDTETGSYVLAGTSKDKTINLLSSDRFYLEAVDPNGEDISFNLLSWKSSNNKAVYFDDYYNNFRFGPTPGKAKITAATTDGGKKPSKSVTLNIQYVDAANFGIRLTDLEHNEVLNEKDNTSEAFSFRGPIANRFKLELMEFIDGKWQDIDGVANIKITFSGATDLTKSGDEREFVPTKNDVTIKVTNTKLKKTRTYKLTNTLTLVTAPSAKADRNLTANSTNEQEILYTVTLPKKDTATVKACDTVQVTVDQSAYASAKEAVRSGYNQILDAWGNYVKDGFYYKLSSYSVRRPIQFNDKNGTFTLNFNSDCEIPVGSYKLQFTYGTVDENNTFIPATKSASVTLKAVKAQNSFKPTTSYNLSAKDTSSVPLTYKAGKDGIKSVYYTLYNKMINVAGDNYVVGDANNFLTYFKLDGDCLALRDEKAVLDALDAKTIKKDDLNGYLSYTVTYTDNSSYSAMVPIKVTLKDTIKKYSASAISVAMPTSKVEKIQLPVTVSKLNADISYAYVDPAGAATVFEGSTEDGNVILKTAADMAKNAKQKVTLYMVPATSLYVRTIDETAKEKQNELIMKYGVKVTANITAKDISAESGKAKVAKISVDTKAVPLTSYDASKGEYYALVPYKMLVAGVDFPEIQAPKYSSLKFADNGDGNIRISVEASNYSGIVSAIKEGKTATIETTATFEQGGYETVKFKLSIPKQTVVTTIDYDTIVELIAEIHKDSSVIPSVYDEKWSGEQIRKKNEAALKAYIDEHLSGNLNADISYSSAYIKHYDDEVTVTVTVTDLSAGSGKSRDFTIGIKLNTRPYEYSDALSTFVQKYQDHEYEAYAPVSNDTTKEDILNAARAELKLPDHLNLAFEEFGITKATDADDGKIRGNLIIRDKNLAAYEYKYHDDDEDDVLFNITRLNTVNETWTKELDPGLDNFTVNNYTTEEQLLTFAKNLISNPDISISIAVDENTGKQWKLTEAGAANGSLVVTFLLENPASQEEGEDSATRNREFTITAPVTADQLITNVTNAITALANNKNALMLTDGGKPKAEEDVRSYIKQQVQAAVGGNPYEVKFINEGDTANEMFTYTKVGYSNKGVLSFGIVLKNLKDGADINDRGFYATVIMDEKHDLQTVSDCTAELIKAELEKVTINTAAQAKVESVKNAMLDAARRVVKENSGINIAYSDDDITYTAPTPNTKGSFAATFEVSKGGDKATVACSVELPAFTQTLQIAVEEVTAALKTVVLTNADIAKEKLADTTQTLVEKAQSAVKSTYQVEAVKALTEDDVKEANEDNNFVGSAEITLKVSIAEPTDDDWTITQNTKISVTVAAPLSEVAEAVKTAVEKYVQESETTPDVPGAVAAAKGVVDTDLYKIVSEDGEKKPTLTITTPEGEPVKVEGYLTIQYVDTDGNTVEEKVEFPPTEANSPEADAA